MSIRWKLFLLLLALGASAAGLGLWTTWITARRTVREQAVARFAGLEPAWRAALEPRLRQLRADVRRLAEDPRYLSCMGQASSDPLDFAGAPGDLRAANLCLTQQALHTRWGSAFVLLNDRGLQIIREGAEERDIGKSFADRAIVHEALGLKTAFDIDRAAGELDVAVPVVSPEGRLFGAALAGIDLADLLASTGRELGVEIASAGSAAPGPPAERLQAGRDLLIQTVALPDLAGRPLLLVELRRDLGAALQPFERSILRGAIVGGALSSLLALVVALFAAGRATRPLRELATGTEAIARGDYLARVPVRGSDEISRLAIGFNAMAEGLGLRVFFESALRRYLAPAVVEDLLRDPARMELGGRRREMTVLFFDVAGFTTLSEALPAEELVALCNGYLEQIVQALFEAGGTLDKFIGDAVMALFGVPLDQPDHAARGCHAALAMQRRFREHVAQSPLPAVRGLTARVGLHSGTAAFGNLGSRSIMSLTAMGDAVNLASRLEGVNKLYGTAILASEATVLAAGAAIEARELDLVRVVGRQRAVKIFQVLEPGALLPVVREAYAAGLVAYRAGRFGEAEAAFQAAAELGDPPAIEMARRARRYHLSPPPLPWDGGWALDHK